MPGMIDTHRHMWQTAMRGYGADWTLTQYFVWYYLEHGQPLPARGRARRQPARRAWRPSRPASPPGRLVARPADRRPRRGRGRRAARRARPVRAGLRQHPAGAVEWTLRRLPGLPRRQSTDDDLLGLPDGLRRHRRPGVPGTRGLRGGPRAGRPGHHARRHVGRDQRRRHPAHARERLHDAEANVYVHAATLSADSYQRIAATGGSVSVHDRVEQSAGQGYPPTWQRRHGIPVSLSMDTSVWWSGDLFSAMRTTLGADRSREHLEAHAKGDTVTNAPAGRAGRRLGHPRRRPGARPGRPRQPRARQEGRRRAAQERPLAGVVPAPQPLRPRRVPGPARRRAHRARRRPRGEARAPAGRLRPPRSAQVRRRPSSTSPTSWARRPGRRA